MLMRRGRVERDGCVVKQCREPPPPDDQSQFFLSSILLYVFLDSRISSTHPMNALDQSNISFGQ